MLSGVPYGLLPVKLSFGKYLSIVLILVRVAPVKSLPTVVVLTFARIVDIVPNKLLTVRVGLGFCLEVYSKPVACIGKRV